MALTFPADLDTRRLRDEIRGVYARVAAAPGGEHPFHRGPDYAAEMLGYDREALARLPADCTAAFAGVANPHRMARLAPGAIVLDIGCGAGVDLLLAAIAVGPTGLAVGVELTEAMAHLARRSARAAGLDNVEVRMGDAQALPLGDATVDVVLSNGVLDLVPDKRRAYAEVLRVLRPGGRFLYADIVVAGELPEAARRDLDLWTARIGGALPEGELVAALATLGFAPVEVRARFDPFRATRQQRVARRFGAVGLNVAARKRA